ncbi:endonuclease/exonuclease/phosphatase family protein [Aureimonas psammosilenae]|uniref:endonuclease/exonuclease/phosphatase family protein n=1 Tax=Aureimonas psammosilenae TaxID=2495496 RepID=UPI0012608291|nr:endonuclease/exonuclease/phosphatase family protein [Aureimonas psammosilenae]
MVRIVYANLGYLREIDGSLAHHIRRAHHHFFTPRAAQMRSLALVKGALKKLQPDLSCFVEIDQGSLTNGFFDQFPILREDHHLTGTIDNKYSATRKYRRLSISRGKSNAFLANRTVDFTRRYLDYGKKRLVYDIDIEGIRVLVVHCALTKRTRAAQYEQISGWIAERDMPTVVVGDFNAMWGESELAPLLQCGRLVHANRLLGPTFRFGPWRAALDTCLISADLERHCRIEIIDQPFSDHKMFKIDVAREGEIALAS